MIKLVDARKGLHEKCVELFHNEKVAESIYMYLCDGIEECNGEQSVEPERKPGKWMLFENQRQEDINNGNYMYTCSNCLHYDIHAKTVKVPYCWFCGAKMEGEG